MESSSINTFVQVKHEWIHTRPYIISTVILNKESYNKIVSDQEFLTINFKQCSMTTTSLSQFVQNFGKDWCLWFQKIITLPANRSIGTRLSTS